MTSKVVDIFLVYQFIKRLILPFEKWDAFKLGIIDKDGHVLKKMETLETPEEKKAWGYYDRLVANLKKLLAKIPGGSSWLATSAAALLLLKEHKQFDQYSESVLTERLLFYVNEIAEEAPANAVGGGAIAGAGVGPQGEPGVYKKRKTPMLRRKYLQNVKKNVLR